METNDRHMYMFPESLNVTPIKSFFCITRVSIDFFDACHVMVLEVAGLHAVSVCLEARGLKVCHIS